MKQLQIAAIFFFLLVTHGFCRPNKGGDAYDDYMEEGGTEDYYSNSPDDGEVAQSTTTDKPGPPPRIVSTPQKIAATPGSTVTLPCRVLNADKYVITWKKGEEILYYDDTSMTGNSDRIVRLTDNSLMIRNLMVNDSSDAYVCTILSNVMPPQVVHSLIVDDGKAFARDKIELTKGETRSFKCPIRISPKTKITWSFKGERLPSGNRIVQGNTVTIHGATRHDAGAYQCLADTSGERPRHGAVHVDVRYPPEVKVEREYVHTGTEEQSKLTCIVHAHPRARVTWLKNDRDVLPRKAKFAETEDKSRYVLILERTAKQDLGNYTCRASNELGESSGVITLTGIPTQATFAGLEKGDETTAVILKWRLESYSPIQEYKLQYHRKGEPWKTVSPRVTDGKGKVFFPEHTITDLQDGSYEAMFMARNDYGWSPRSEPYTFFSEDVSEEPQKIQESSSAVTTQPLAVLATVLLVVPFYASTNI